MASALIGGAGGAAIRLSLLQARVGCTVSTSNATCSAGSTVTTTCVATTTSSTTTACCARAGGGRSSSSMTGRSSGGLPSSPPAAATSETSSASNNSGGTSSPPRFWQCAPPSPILLAASGGKSAAAPAQTAGRSVSVAALSTLGRSSEDRQVQVFVAPPPPLQNKDGQGGVHGCLWNAPEFLAAALLSVAAGAAGAMVSGASHRGEAGGTVGAPGQRASVSLSVKHAGGTHRLFDGGGGGEIGVAGGGGGGGGSGGGGRTPWSSNGPMKDGYEATHSTVSTMHTASSRPYEVSVRAVRGGRLYMEDEYFITEGGRFAAVFDGHGGSGVSRYLRENLYDRMRYYLCDGEEEEGADDREAGRRALAALFQSSLSESGASSSSSREFPTMAERVAALRSAFREVDREVLADDNLEHQGSTAVAVVLHESRDGCRSIISANIGDSRAVLSRRGRAVDLTRDHKPNDEKEKARIMSLGEEVEWDGYSGVYRVQNLSLSRAIGDRFAKPAVSGEVEIKRFPVTDDGDEFVILASDGLWDVMESQDAVNFVHKKLGSPIPLDDSKLLTEKTRRRHMSRYLANEALRRGSGDNICVVVVWLKRKKPSSEETN